ncbi:MAG: class I SAM-dependent methyltransferase [Nitrincola lacisaponensis]|uniref:class I SAM-dependent methyltransferase n=1 Tax=Nitrincola lacisaponensis TaxID=267850 RepID=UPI00391DD374
MENVYGKLASWVYHLDKPIGRSFGDLEYYSSRLEGCSGPVLEPGVGNGRIYIPMLERGFNIEGFDASEEMLAYCRRESSLRNLSPKLTCQTFSDFSYSDKFEVIIIPAGTFQLIFDFSAAMTVLRRFYSYLMPGGRIILDIDAMKGIIEASDSIRRWSVSEDELLTLTSSAPQVDCVNQTALSYLRYEHWSKGQLITTEMDLFYLRWWGVNELILALNAVGFTDVIASGGYEYGKEPSQDDLVITLEAQRPLIGA